jgi:epoxyqueuosine reductase
LADRILDKAKAFGASLAGLVPLSALREPASHLATGLRGPAEQASILVLALEHPESEPELDWWGGVGGTEGNRRLIALSGQMRRFLARELDLRTQPLPYHPWKGGVLLKDAAVLAGLGCIGANNLLITPDYGPRLRLRALRVDLEIAPVQTPTFAPCTGCLRPCWQACPQQAFAAGAFEKSRCARQMERDEANPVTIERDGTQIECVPYCRACELDCPVGRIPGT